MSQQTLSVPPREASKLTYAWYINSSRWERRKVLYYSRNEKKCRACGSTEDIELHHHTYKRMGAEHDDDLIPLCKDHHVAVHRVHRATRGMSLTAATRQVVGGPLHLRRQKSRSQKPRPQKGRPVEAKVDKLPVKAVTARFGISGKILHYQGYHTHVPVEKVRQWAGQRPDWMSETVPSRPNWG